MPKPHIKKHIYGGYWYCHCRDPKIGDVPGRGETPADAYEMWRRRNA